MISLMGTGQPILKDNRGYNQVQHLRRARPKIVSNESIIDRRIRILKEQRLASIMGLR